ncbi:Hypothetical Protein FCC1311_088522 [Hondaea fermentalgiana]|uniref:Uncharacterized protein n=1 Tax=Hondaea fermentalgiana TaxID=2315210 RepID=A0A2R5GP25_9STRA|nr:Hypothetical Protein FCC1311_088522 [Hondaea fermentalgiana]|eukprot:GBG32627.1 Hypothetical Protein FCC1311_088522 [Hondaea fermentalgiana]
MPECNAKKPCTEYECRKACSDYDWCKYYEFQDIDPMYVPEGSYIEDGHGRCELHKEDMDAYQASSKAVCYRKRQA